MGRVSTVAPVPRERCGLRASAPSVPRSRLLEQLDRLPGGGLALVVAPAGSGKSVLLSQWSRSRPDLRMATLSLTPRHDDAVAFARDLATALRPVLPQVGSRLDDAVMTGGSVLGERFVSQLTDELAAAPPGLAIILDDLHLLTNASVVAGLERLVTETPVTTRWVIAARWDPALHLARLRVDDRLVELRAEHLAFDEAEAHELIEAVAHREVPADSVRTLVDRTDGWAAGLQLASISLRDVEDPAAFVTDFAGTDRLVVEYLTQEVLDRQDPHAYRFLLDTSVLPWLSAELCDAVTGRADSREQLNRLVEQSLFVVPLDRGGDRFRYHPLFADLLHYRLDAERPESIASLHEAAARWLRTRGEHAAAIEELLAAGAPLAAFDVVAEEGQSLFERGESATLAGWLTQIRHQVPTPPATLEVSLLAAQVAADQVGAASETYRQLRRRLDLTLGEQATADALYTCLGFDDLPSEEVLKASDNVRAILPLVTRRSVPDFLGVGGYDSVQFMAEFMASVAHFHRGDLGAAMARLERTSTLPGMSYSVWRIYLLGLRGLVLAWSGRLTEADQQVQACLTAADDAGLRAREFSSYAYQAAAICAIDRHHLDEAEHLLAESALRNQLRTRDATFFDIQRYLEARLAAARGHDAAALAILELPARSAVEPAVVADATLRARRAASDCVPPTSRGPAPASQVGRPPPSLRARRSISRSPRGATATRAVTSRPGGPTRRTGGRPSSTGCERPRCARRAGTASERWPTSRDALGLGRDRAAPSPVPRSANPGAAPSRPGQEQHREVRAVAARRRRRPWPPAEATGVAWSSLSPIESSRCSSSSPDGSATLPSLGRCSCPSTPSRPTSATSTASWTWPTGTTPSHGLQSSVSSEREAGSSGRPLLGEDPRGEGSDPPERDHRRGGRAEDLPPRHGAPRSAPTLTAVASLAEIAGTQTELDDAAVAHLQRFIGSWGLVADLCFSDLLLFVPTDAEGTHFVVAGQVRPTTNQTLYVRDLLGEIADREERPLIARSWRRGEIIEGEVTDPIIRERVRMLCIPLRFRDETVAVLSRESTPSVGRPLANWSGPTRRSSTASPG